METRMECTLGVQLTQAQKHPSVAQVPLGPLPTLWKGPSSQKQEWLDPGPLGEPRVSAQRLPALRPISQWLLSPEREAGLPVAREVMSQAPGARSGKSETKDWLLRLGDVKVLSHPLTTTWCRGDQPTTGATGGPILWDMGLE